MALLEVMEMEVHPSLGGKLSKDDWIIYEQAQKEFLSQIDCSLKGVEKVRAIYKLVDELTDKYRKNNFIACGRGCPWCCYQMVCCTRLEAELIFEYFQSLCNKGQLIIKIKVNKAMREYNVLYNSLTSQIDVQNNLKEFHKSMQRFYNGKSCLYLHENDCLIYPVRTIDCRTAKAEQGCGPENDSEIKGIRLFVDQIASDLIIEEEKENYNQIAMIPLFAWFAMPEFAQRFF